MAAVRSGPDAAPGFDSGAALREGPNDVPGLATNLALSEERIATVVSAAWELELVIAGGVTFALFQLPTSLETARQWLDARATGVPPIMVGLGYMYVKLMVYVLLGAFLLNLTSRAYWVGLVGLHSVFPRGIDWERQRFGPAARDVYRERLASLPAVIARVDNFASVIFSFAFLIVIMVVFTILVAGVFSALSWAVNATLFGGRPSYVAFQFIGIVLALPLITLGLVDKFFGARWPADGVAGRRLRALTRLSMRVNGMSVLGPIYLTLLTNLRRGVMLTLFYGVLFGGLLLAAGEFLFRVGALSGGTPRYVPDLAEIGGLDIDYYESLRTPEASTTVPTIQSDVIEGPYVRLFIPYLVARHDPALAAGCPGARPQRPGRVHVIQLSSDPVAANRSADTVLACLARMHAITLDGVARPDVLLRFYTHPVTGRRGMIAYLATAPLAPGSHTLSVLPPPRAPASTNRRPLQPYVIPFQR